MGVNQSAKRKHHIKDDEEVNFDHFQILRAIGKGSFGKVCIVQKKDTGQMYAMKYMSKNMCFERDALRNVLREIEILTQLDHPFLVNLWFSFHDEEDMFLVQDLLLGGDLRYHLMQNVMFPPEAVRIYIAELGMALDYLQQKHIIHRDIKPDNILLDEEGHAHLTDFNVATKLEDGREYASALSGTKPYMAPEIFSSYAEEIPGYRYAVDWWSLGVVVYELCSGRRPYEIHSHTPNKEIRQMLKAAPEYPPAWPSELTMLVQQLLHLDALQRITTLESLKAQPYMMEMNFEDVYEKKVAPCFVPPKGHLNCDPTFELEEMIVESRPLHKKKKRLAKQRSLRELQTTPYGGGEQEQTLDPLAEEFTTFNRQRELERIERERKEAEWEQELLRAMEASSTFSSNPARKEFRLSDSQLPAECQSPGSGLESPSSSSSLAHPSTSSAVAGFRANSPFISKPSTSTARRNEEAEAEDGDNGAKGGEDDVSKLPSIEGKKQAWAKRRSLTMPEGAKLWKKSLKN